MSEPSTTPDAKEQIANHLYFASLYFITVGVLHLWGYWSSFGINILEYLALTDIVKATAYPIAITLLVATIGAAIGEGLANRIHLPLGSGRVTAIGHSLRRFAPLLWVYYVIGAVALLSADPVVKSVALPVLLALPIYIFVKQKNFLTKVIPDESARSIVIFMLVVLPVLAYGRGWYSANMIHTGRAFTYAVSELTGYSPESNIQSQPRLIGHAGDHMFFFDPVKTAVVIVKFESGKSFVLKRYKIPKDVVALAGSNPSLKGTSAGKSASAP